MLSLFLKMWHTLKKIGIFTFCMLITQLIKAQLRYSQLENIEIINLKLVLCLPLILIDGANTVDFAKSSVLKDMLFWFFCFSTQKKWRQNSNWPNTKIWYLVHSARVSFHYSNPILKSGPNRRIHTMTGFNLNFWRDTFTYYMYYVHTKCIHYTPSRLLAVKIMLWNWNFAKQSCTH